MAKGESKQWGSMGESGVELKGSDHGLVGGPEEIKPLHWRKIQASRGVEVLGGGVAAEGNA